MSQIPLFDSQCTELDADQTKITAASSYRRFVFHGEISETPARKLLTSFLKQLRKIDPRATATLEDIMSNGPWNEMPFLCIDTETTGLDRHEHSVIEVAWVLFQGQKELFAESYLCRHEQPLSAEIISLTGITSEMVKDEKPFGAHVPALLEAFSKASFIVAYNANFDKLFLESEFAKIGQKLPEKHWIDPCVYIREIDRFQKGKRLTDASKRWGVELKDAHRALADAKAAGLLLYKLASHLNAFSLPELIVLQRQWQEEQEKSYKAYVAKKQAISNQPISYR